MPACFTWIDKEFICRDYSVLKAWSAFVGRFNFVENEKLLFILALFKRNSKKNENNNNSKGEYCSVAFMSMDTLNIGSRRQNQKF